MDYDYVLKYCRMGNHFVRFEDFGPRKASRDGKMIYCRACVAVYHRRYKKRKGRPPLKNLDGVRFGKLVVLEEGPRISRYRRRMVCVCDCGEKTIVDMSSLTSGHSQSCGCMSSRETFGDRVRKHGKTNTAEYKCYAGIKRRCYNENEVSYPDYGGRGIVVCESWLESFENFLSDMGPKPSPSHSIDRIDSNGNYEKSNCRWSTREVQANNKRSSNRYEFLGKSLTLPQWGRLVGIKHLTISARLKIGWTLEDALTTPVLGQGKRRGSLSPEEISEHKRKILAGVRGPSGPPLGERDELPDGFN